MSEREVNDDRILIIDDDQSTLSLLQLILEKAGLKSVRCVEDPRLAVHAFTEFNPDLVMLDLAMPQIDGFGVLETLRKNMDPDDFRPVIIVTGESAPEAKERALSSGANDYVDKPFVAKEIYLRVNNLLRTRRLHLQLKESNLHLEETVAERTRDLMQAMKDLRDTQQQVVQQERLRA